MGSTQLQTEERGGCSGEGLKEAARSLLGFGRDTLLAAASRSNNCVLARLSVVAVRTLIRQCRRINDKHHERLRYISHEQLRYNVLRTDLSTHGGVNRSTISTRQCQRQQLSQPR